MLKFHPKVNIRYNINDKNPRQAENLPSHNEQISKTSSPAEIALLSRIPSFILEWACSETYMGKIEQQNLIYTSFSQQNNLSSQSLPKFNLISSVFAGLYDHQNVVAQMR